MANVHVVLSGDLSDILYQLSAAHIVSINTQKFLSVSSEKLKNPTLRVLKNIKCCFSGYSPNEFYDVDVKGDSLIPYIPKCRKSIQLIGSFKNRSFFTQYRNQLIQFYGLESVLNLEDSMYVYIDKTYNDHPEWYKVIVNHLLKNTNNKIYLVTDNVEISGIDANERVEIIDNVDDNTKLCIMANCRKGGYYTGYNLGWWGSFLNKYSESTILNESVYNPLYDESEQSLVFITMPTYNRGAKCVKVIDQIKNQTYNKWKLLIIDDGSLEEHAQVIREKVKDVNDNRIVYLKNEVNMKVVKTLNRGIDKFLEEKYDFFTWISDDNEYFPDFIRNLAVKNKDFIYSGHTVKQGNSKIEIKRTYQSARDLLDGFWGLGSFMWSRKAIQQIGHYNYSISLLEDYDYLIRTFLVLPLDRICFKDVFNMEYDCHEETLYLRNIDYIKDKHKQLVLFYYKIDLSKPLLLYYTKGCADLSLDLCSQYMNSSYTKVVVRNNKTIEYNSENDVVYIGNEDVDLVVNLFNLIDKKVILYDDRSILEKVKNYTNVKLINTNIDVSIVMSYFNNRKHQTLRTLNRFEELYGNKYNFEVIIADDNSLEENRLDSVIHNYSFPIRYRYITKEEKGDRINPCMAYNIGFKLAKGDVIVIQNPECYHASDILGNVQKNISDVNYLTYSCFSANSEDLTKEVIEDINKINDTDYLVRNEMNYNINWYNHPLYHQTNYHFCSAITKNNLEILGGFDETFADGYCFDDDEFLLSIKYILRLNICCMNHDNGFVIHQYHKRSDSNNIDSADDTNVVKQKWIKNKFLFEEKKSHLELSNFNYPRLLHLYWDGSPLSLLNFCTILSFNEYHKYWRIILYMPTQKTEKISWVSNEQKQKYTEKCYRSELTKIKNLVIKYIDFNNIGFYNEASEVIKSDYFRYYILQKYGGVWSDMDIIYTNNVENKINFTEDVVLFRCVTYSNPKNKLNSDNYTYYPIGWFAAKRNNDFFSYILEECRKQYDPSNYQTLGASLFYSLFNDVSRLYNNVNYTSKVIILNEEYYLPWAWNELDEFLEKTDNTLPQNNFGIHWFNGADKSKRYSNQLTTRLLNNNFSISCYLDKFIDKYRSFFNKTISIIMAYHNKRDQLLMTLDSINKSNYNKKYLELIIVDDHSKEEQRLSNFLDKEKYNFEIKTIWIDKKDSYNPCYAYNIGIQESKGEILILQNPEVMLIGDCIQFVFDNLKQNDWLTLNTYGLGSFDENIKIQSMSQLEIYNLIESYNKMYDIVHGEKIQNIVQSINYYKKELATCLADEKQKLERFNTIRLTINAYETELMNDVKFSTIKNHEFRDLKQESLDIQVDITVLTNKKENLQTILKNLKQEFLEADREKVITGGNTYFSKKNIGGWLNYYHSYFLGYHYYSAIHRNDLNSKMGGGFYDGYKDGICFDDNDFVMYLHYNKFNFKINRFEPNNCFAIHLFHEKSIDLDQDTIKKLWTINRNIYHERCNQINYPKEVDICLKDSKYVPKPILI